MASFARGFLILGRRTPLRLHWTLPLGAFLLGGARVRPWFWLAYLIVMFVHEAGHAVLAWRFRKRVVALDIHGMGGDCHWRGHATPMERAGIAWGGVLAQALLLLGTAIVVATLGPPESDWSAELRAGFMEWNALILGLNLLPVRSLDGVEAWPLVPLVLRRIRAGRARRRRPALHDPAPIDLDAPRTPKEQAALADIESEIRDIVDRASKD